MPSDEGPHRKYYSLTASGHDLLQRSGKTWVTFSETMTALLATSGRAA